MNVPVRAGVSSCLDCVTTHSGQKTSICHYGILLGEKSSLDLVLHFIHCLFDIQVRKVTASLYADN